MAEKIKVMTFNLRVAVKGDGVNYFDYRLPRILEFLNAEKPDVVGFQEVNDHMKEALNEHLTDYVIVGCGRESSYRGESACLAYRKDRFQLITLENFWLSATPTMPGSRYGIDQSSCPRVTTAALLKLREASAPFWFVNTHLDHRGAEAQKNGLALIVERIASINPQGYPMVLTGDFNIKPNNPALVDLDKIMQCTRKVALVTDNHNTFNGWGKAKSDSVIDYIYFSGFSRCVEYQTVTKEYGGRKFISDHFPIISTLVF